NRHIGAEAEYVVLVDPKIIRRLGGTGIALEARAGERIKRKALRTFVAELRSGPVERTLALAPVEAADVAGVERDPHHTVAVDIHAANAEARRRHLVDFGKRRIGRIRSRREANNVARMAEVRAPDRAVGRRIGNAVHAEGDAG